MRKGYYIFGILLLGVGGYLLYDKIKKGNAGLNSINQDVVEADSGSHLEPPMQTPTNTPPLSTPPFIPTF